MLLKWGILSAANISNDFVLSMNTLNQNEHKVVAIAATNLESAEKFSKKFNIPKAYGSYQELVNDPEVDVIYIGTKSILHFSTAKLCIEHGKHVLIEKPMTCSIETTKELYELGKKHQVFVLEALFSRFLPSYFKIREIINSGQIGELVHVQSNFVMSNLHDGIILRKFGAGVSFAVGVYALNAIFEAVNYKYKFEELNIKAFGRSYSENGKDGGDMTITAIFDFPNQLTASLLMTLKAGGSNLDRVNYTNYIGTKGYIKVNKLNNPSEIEVNGQIVNVSTNDNQKGYWLDNSHGLRFQCEEVRKCIMNKQLTSEIHKPEHSILLIQVIRKMLKDVGSQVVETPREFDFSYF